MKEPKTEDGAGDSARVVKIKFSPKEPTDRRRDKVTGEFTFKDTQTYCGGIVERVHLPDGRIMYVGEEAHFQGAHFNPEASRLTEDDEGRRHKIYGNAVICGKPPVSLPFGINPADKDVKICHGGYEKGEAVELRGDEIIYTWANPVDDEEARDAAEQREADRERHLADAIQVTSWNKYFDDEPYGPKG